MVKLVDPNCPKKPSTPFFAWRKDNYHRICKTMDVGYSFKEINQELSTQWKAVTESEKQPLEEEYRKGLAKYKKLMNAYKLTTSYKAFQTKKANAKVEGLQKTKFRKDPNAPKRPLSGYFIFMGDKRDEVKAANPDINHKQVLSKLAGIWKNMSDSEKKVYNDRAEGGKKAYAVELEKYKNSAEYKQYQTERAEFNASKKSKLTTAKQTAKKRSNPDSEEYQPKAKKAKKSSGKKKSKKSKSKKVKSPRAKKSSPRTKKSSPRTKKTSKPKAPKSKARKSKGKKSKAKKSKRRTRKAKAVSDE